MTEVVKVIPAEELKDCQGWSIPDVSSGNTVPAVMNDKPRKNSSKTLEKKALKNKALKGSVKDHHSTEEKVIEESIEVVGDAIVKPISAEDLQAISDAAEKEGFDKGYKKGFEQAKESGHKEGYSKGLEDGQHKITEQSDRLHTIVEDLLSPLEHEREVLEKQMVDIISQLTKAVIIRELSIDSSVILTTVRQSLELLTEKNNPLKIYLNSQDIEVVRSSLSERQETLHYQVDDTLLAGGCRIESSETRIYHTIEERIEQIVSDFVEKRNPINEIDKEESHVSEALTTAPSSSVSHIENSADKDNDEKSP